MGECRDGELIYIENVLRGRPANLCGNSIGPTRPTGQVFVVRTWKREPLRRHRLRRSNSAWLLADLDNDGTLRPRPSIDKLRPHVFCRSQATWTSSWAMAAQLHREHRDVYGAGVCVHPASKDEDVCPGDANPFDGIDVGGFTASPSLGDIDNDGTLRPCPSIDKLRPHA